MKLNAISSPRTVPQAEAEPLALEQFLPYRLSVLTNWISGNLAKVYAQRFDLSVPEWRVLAVVGRFSNLSANEVAEKSAMDKVTVSRAVNRLIEKGRLARNTAADDRRRSSLHMTATGRAIYRRIVPLARVYEKELLQSLNTQEQAQLDRLLQILQKRAETMGGRESKI